MEKKNFLRKRTCPNCGFESTNIYDFNPSFTVQNESQQNGVKTLEDFRIFHSYGLKNGHLFCNKCKEKFLKKKGWLKNGQLEVKRKEYRNKKSWEK